MKVVFYRTSSGRCFIYDFLDSITESERHRILLVLDSIAIAGFNAAGCQFCQLEKKLWEIKISSFRIFYTLINAEVIFCLHIYRKQSNRAPKLHLAVARKRLKEVL